MPQIEYTGEFFLPDREKRYPGRVLGDEESSGLILEVYGNETIEGSELKQNLPSSKFEYHHEIILGSTNHPQHLTLLRCEWAGTKQIGKKLFIVTYRIETIIKNAFINSYNGIRFGYVTVSIPYISSWYDDWPSFGEFLNERNNREEQIQSLTINSNLSIKFIDFISSTTQEFGKTKKISTQKYVQFHYSNGELFDEIIRDIVRLTKLLEFCLSKRIHFKLIDAAIEKRFTTASDSNFTNSSIVSIFFDNFSYVQKQDVSKHYIHQNKMLLSRSNLEESQLNSVIVTWFSNKGHYHIYDFYLDSNNWFEGTGAVLSNVMFNNRFLNLVQALEDFHRKTNEILTPDKEDFDRKKKDVLKLIDKNSSLKKWVNDSLKYSKFPSLKERIESLVEKADDIISALFKEKAVFKDFPRLAKEYRDFLSHGNMKSTYQGEELIQLFFMAQVLLSICILQSLKLANGTIQNLMERNIDVNNAVSEIKFRRKSIQREK